MGFVLRSGRNGCWVVVAGRLNLRGIGVAEGLVQTGDVPPIRLAHRVELDRFGEIPEALGMG